MFESIVNFFKRLKKTEEKNVPSKDTAKERLHLVLMQDRANVSADFLELMKQEIIEVIKKYIDVEEEAIDVRLTNEIKEDGTTGAPSLYANIPIVNIKNEKKKEVEEKAKETNKVEKKEESKEQENEIIKEEKATEETENAENVVEEKNDEDKEKLANENKDKEENDKNQKAEEQDKEELKVEKEEKKEEKTEANKTEKNK